MLSPCIATAIWILLIFIHHHYLILSKVSYRLFARQKANTTLIHIYIKSSSTLSLMMIKVMAVILVVKLKVIYFLLLMMIIN